MNIFIKDFQKKILPNPRRIKKTILNVLSFEGTKKSGEITICFVNDLKIKELNRKYLHKNYPTDVLVFDLTEERDRNRIFADIIISTDAVIRNASIYQTPRLYELNLYIVHGLLHLLGYDDKTRKQRKIIDKKASDILASIAD